MDEKFIKSIDSMEFSELRELILAFTDRLKVLSEDDNLLFKKLLGQVVSHTISNSVDDKINQMQLIIDYQYNHLNSFKQNLIRTCYGASEDNLGMLQICFPFEVTAFTKYGRENVNELIRKIKELRD